ncbi:3-methyladenine DNA glycosylase/8-oxoguanine DNA glycosylase [Streptosporangium becharense]|uniref:3-methyladenine DNA glycosylase/8-oxoguanine DNA glycosylase n=1 Tax=Streptosporangium becharense TaxID=1816182 RepID=A0A7W9IEM8_9ACTN|nr:DNA-3-methyladenine glycosylase 2 family protein [Streptosporangium becharense]MBB2909695.1 3-methyladenine DNA glycosylase/8-oxoguanine DNA glycosylase [Streptosporangium becharense]MBB5819349.1 3-methyladenine DNA glycosylase/8-oxoguanine DNA glycosylase [Streptosporangium becharense]
MMEREWRPAWPLDLRLTLGPHRRGAADPTWHKDAAGAIWRTSRTPDGPATLRVAARGGWVAATAWGPGAEWTLQTLPALLGAEDDVTGFTPGHEAVRRAAGRHPGLRIGRTFRVLEALVPAVLEQKVVHTEARRAWRWLLHRYGEPAPGPAPREMRVFPSPEVWRSIPSWDWHRAGVEAVRARTITGAAGHAAKLEAAGGSAEADRLLRALPGVGVWTSAEVRQRSHGDADAVSVGDFHLPSLVGWSLAGERTDDAGMLRLLAPYRGHRHRVSRLLGVAGARPPARGPRVPARDYRSF